MSHQKTEPLCNDLQDRVEAFGYLGAGPKPNLLSGLQTKLGRRGDKYPECASYLIM